jgi:uncharacterized protein YggU (UPF0235/DUF167 family)
MTAAAPREMATEQPSSPPHVRVVPGRRRHRLVDVVDGVLRIGIVGTDDRQINRAVIDCLAEAMDVGPDALTIVSGRHSATKTISIEGIAPDDLAALLCELAPTPAAPHPDELPVDYHDAK